MDKTIEQKVMEEPDLMAAKMILTDDLQKRFDANVSFTLFQELYDCFPLYRNNVAELEYSELMRKKYISVYHAVEDRLDRWKAGVE